MIDTENPVVSFTALDRCDGCGAQAYFLVAREDMPADLLLCINHARRYRDTLEDQGWTIIEDFAGIAQLLENEKAGV